MNLIMFLLISPGDASQASPTPPGTTGGRAADERQKANHPADTSGEQVVFKADTTTPTEVPDMFKA
jgi:hypothetical protein